MVKELVDHRFDTLEGLQNQLNLWFPSSKLNSFIKMKGGYSCTNYKLFIDNNNDNNNTEKIYVLKVCHGYSLNDVEDQAVIPYVLKNKYGFSLCCSPYLLSTSNTSSDTSNFLFAAPMYDNEEPCLLLNYLDGRSADALIEENLLDIREALPQIGESLASLHAIKVNKEHFLLTSSSSVTKKDNELLLNNKILKLRSYLQDGICFLFRHINNDYLTMINNAAQEDSFIHSHFFRKYYEDCLPSLQETIHRANELDYSILHGDSFIDNILFHTETKKIV